MRFFKLVIELKDGSKIWINLLQLLKMELTANKEYYLHLVNGEKYLINHQTARMVENYFEGR